MKKHILNHQNLFRKKCLPLGFALGCFFLVSCSSGGNENNAQNDQESASTESPAATANAPAADEGKGVGPVKTVDLGTGIDQALADKGKAVFESKCTACHKFGDRYVGPDLAGVTERRKPEWVMNMVLNPEEMVQQDPTAKELLGEFMTQMPNQNLTEEEARAVLEYFRTQTKK
ncbi:c-type cytochrome [Adhaeribacter rhizoryzae]|uniref:Cytochrome c n=1 Tax=Adhaeribacter rhizoryzae TaxID=2607907 RepID=A0A5M6CY04_9BACT|nr:cytochrome c [Adhaeribacter rhizoryzae]KAA5539983.1 cytochrome c [Adhaeribacter rhizoryzae]